MADDPHAEDHPLALLRMLRAEAELFWDRAPRVSNAIADCMIALAESYGLDHQVALGEMTRGDTHRILGNHQLAVEWLTAAGDRFRGLGDEVGWARTRTGRVLALYAHGDPHAGLPDVLPAREILVRHREWLRAAGLMLNVGNVYEGTGDFSEAQRCYADALGLYEQAAATNPEQREIAYTRAQKARANQATMLAHLGDYVGALREHQAALSVFEQAGDRHSVLLQQHNIAELHLGYGQYPLALQFLLLAEATAMAQDLEAERGLLEIDMAECHLRLNRDDRALALAERARARFEQSGDSAEVARADLYRALVLVRRDDYASAVALLEQARSALHRAGRMPAVGLVHLALAQVHLVTGAWSEARAQAGQAQATFAERGAVLREAQSLLAQAEACLGQHETEHAEALTRQALERIGLPVPFSLAHLSQYVLARVAQARGHLDEANALYEQAMVSVEQGRFGLTGELGARFVDDKVRIFEEAISLNLSRGQTRVALAYLERAKSRVLVDYITSAGGAQAASTPAPARALAQLRAEHNWYFTQLYGQGLTPGASEGGSSGARAALSAAMFECERKITALREEIELLELAARPASDLPDRTVVDQRQGAPDAIVLEYYLSETTSAVFVLDAERVDMVPLDVAPSRIERLLDVWDRNRRASMGLLAAGQSVGSLARHAEVVLGALYEALLAPVAERLDPRRGLVIVPYGILHNVPFHALYDARRRQFVVERFEVSACPSRTLLQICQGRARRTLTDALVIGHSAGGALPYAVQEARQVSALLPGVCYVEEQARPSVIASNAAHYGILHLAAHGQARLDDPSFSYLLLADGSLEMADVVGLPLAGALVTLSGCETGRPAVTRGDEVLNLSRGFLYAGASTVIQSLWPVVDDVTRDLMVSFYSEVKAGATPAAALRAAQQAALRRAAHPCLWAPFQLIGHGGQ